MMFFHDITFAGVCEATTMYLIVHGILKGLYWVLHSGERSAAILLHYQRQAIGQGHDQDSVLDCRQGKCTVFAA